MPRNRKSLSKTHPDPFMKNQRILFIAIVALVLGAAPLAHADSLSEIKVRMSQRLEQVVALKQSGSVGENNFGYLTERKSLSAENRKVVAAENADRKAVYEAIAAKTNTLASKVGVTRAASIRNTAPEGTWVQLPDGGWKQL